jgi:hypothetical protein
MPPLLEHRPQKISGLDRPLILKNLKLVAELGFEPRTFRL